MRWRWTSFVAAVALWGVMLAVDAAVLSVKPEAGGPRNRKTAVVALQCKPGEIVAAVQFDLVFSGALASRAPKVEAGDGAKTADKQVSSSPISDTVLRVLVAGLNQTPITGEEIAIVSVAGPWDPGKTTLGFEIAAPLLADPKGLRVPVVMAVDVSHAAKRVEDAVPGTNRVVRNSLFVAALLAGLAFGVWTWFGLKKTVARL